VELPGLPEPVARRLIAAQPQVRLDERGVIPPPVRRVALTLTGAALQALDELLTDLGRILTVPVLCLIGEVKAVIANSVGSLHRLGSKDEVLGEVL
jgi:hypothetical protein